MSEPKSRRELALLAMGGVTVTAVATAAGRAIAEPQPAMQRAKQALEEALHFLEAASSDKGGYKLGAMKSVKAAIAQVDAGIRFDNTH
jgi:hypothetical protein